MTQAGDGPHTWGGVVVEEAVELGGVDFGFAGEFAVTHGCGQAAQPGESFFAKPDDCQRFSPRAAGLIGCVEAYAPQRRICKGAFSACLPNKGELHRRDYMCFLCMVFDLR